MVLIILRVKRNIGKPAGDEIGNTRYKMVNLSYGNVCKNTSRKARLCGGCGSRDDLIKRGEKAVMGFKYGYERLFHYLCFITYFTEALRELKGEIKSGRKEWVNFKEEKKVTLVEDG